MPDRDKINYATSFNSLLEAIVRQAQEDGRISNEESELIHRIQIDARTFEAEVAKILKEGGSLSDVFTKSKDTMIKNATEVAKNDGVITEDEQAIINKLISELEDIKHS